MVLRLIAAVLLTQLLGGGSAAAPRDTCAETKSVDCIGDDIGNKATPTFAACCDLCHATPGCAAFTLDQFDGAGKANPTCYMKSGCSATKAAGNCDSGTVGSGPPQKPPAPAPPAPPVPALPPVPPPPPVEPLPWPQATALAKSMVARMNQTEKYSMMKQIGWIDGAPLQWWCKHSSFLVVFLTSKSEQLAAYAVQTSATSPASSGSAFPRSTCRTRRAASAPAWRSSSVQ